MSEDPKPQDIAQGSSVTDEQRRRNRRRLAVALPLLFIALLVFQRFFPFGDDTERRLQVDAALRRDAFEVCQRFVRERLKAPRTAEFQSYTQGAIERVNDDDYERRPFKVSSSVDAQNAFGAMLRSDYTCVVRPGRRYR